MLAPFGESKHILVYECCVGGNSSVLGCCKFYYSTKAQENLGVHQLLPYRTALDLFQKYTNNTCKIRKISKKKYFILRTPA